MDQNTKDVLFLLIPAVSALVTAYVAMVASRTKAKVETVAADVASVKETTNGHTELLIAATRRAAHAQGMADEREEQRVREAKQ